MQELDLTPEQEQEVVDEGVVLELDPSEENEGVEELASDIKGAAAHARVGGYKCQKCNLAHTHDTDKHRASDSYGLTHEDAAGMEFNPNCHCGLHNVAHRSGELGVSDAPTPSRANDLAPVPSDVQRDLRS